MRYVDVVDEMIAHQEKKLISLAREIVPYVTEDDVLQPNDFPELEESPLFRYEEGVLKGMYSVRAALLASFF